MSSLTIVVPRLGTGAAFENTLASILRYRLPHHQVIVVQGAADVDDFGLGDEAMFVPGPDSTCLAEFVARAIPVATGNVVNLVLPGVEVGNQWFAPAMRELTQADVGCVSIPVKAGEQQYSQGLGIDADGLPYHVSGEAGQVSGPTQWAACFRRSLLEQLALIDDELGDDLFGLEVGLAAEALGLRSIAASSGCVTLEDGLSIDITRGYRSGVISRRVQQRYGTNSHSLFARIAAAIRLGLNVVQPAKWTYLAGRKSATRWLAADEEFAAQLDSIANCADVPASELADKRHSPRRAA